MVVAPWNPRFETGIALIDRQHRRLFEAVQELSEAFAGGARTDRSRRAMDALMDCAVEHFRTEEEFMQAHAFPGFAAHAGEHARLTGEALQLRSALEAGRPLELQVTTFFSDWLVKHIQEVDLGYVAFLKARGVR